jgi:hypothetical protein
MSHDFNMGTVDFPSDKEDQVLELLKKHDLERMFEIQDWKGGKSLSPQWWDVGCSTATTITDDLLPDIASLVKDTPHDGQVIQTEFDGEQTTYILALGIVQQVNISGEPIYVKGHPEITLGQEIEIDIRVKVIGVGNKQAVITQYLDSKDGET